MIISISGKLGSGKDFIASTLCNKIQANLGLTFERRSYAYKLKHISSILSGKPLPEMFTQDGKNAYIESFDMTVGRMQQIIGTDVFRKWDENVWIKALFSEYDVNKSNWIITDTRFKNEADYIKSIGGLLIRIEGDLLGIRANSSRDLTHPSETELDDYADFNIVYDNNETGETKIAKSLYPLVEEFIINKKSEMLNETV